MSDEREERALAYIVGAIEQIAKDVQTDPRALIEPERMSARSVLWLLLTLSDSTTKLSGDLRDRHPEVPWAKVRGFRNFAAHAYDQLRLQVVAAIVQDEEGTAVFAFGAEIDLDTIDA